MGIGDELGDLGGEDSPIDDALGFIQDIFAAEPTEQQSDLESGPLMNEMEYEIETSPTYLNVNESVDNEEVPSVRPPGSSVMDLDDGEHRPMATSYTQRLPTPGLPLSPVPPALYYLQLNSYNIELDGEYSRFEVSATAGDPASGESTTFVRDQMDVEVEIGGEEQKIGEVDPIDIDASTEIVVFMPGAVPMQMGAPPNVGEPNFGDGTDDKESDNWDDTGPQHPSD